MTGSRQKIIEELSKISYADADTRKVRVLDKVNTLDDLAEVAGCYQDSLVAHDKEPIQIMH
jgi:hypothetical protein